MQKENELIFAINNKDKQTYEKLTEQFLNNIDEVLRNTGNNLLHIAADNGNFHVADFLMKSYDKKILSQPLKFDTKKKVKWINQKDEEGFTALHYAVFRHSGPLALLLEQHGADIYQVNNQGLNVLHIAAQGGSPILLFYYISKGFRISTADSKGSTALHWACYSSKQHAVAALLSWGAQIDLPQPTNGMTPLHLAVISGDGKIVRNLLMKGCDRDVKNYQGKKPIDYAKQNEYCAITEMLEDKIGIQQIFNLKTPFHKMSRFQFPFFLFIFLFLTNYIFNLSYFFSSSAGTRLDLAITFITLGLTSFILYIILFCSNPGKIKSIDQNRYFEMLRKNSPSIICYDCALIKPQRSKHCNICNACIKVYDHHCPWIGNCVGAGNYAKFYLFIFNLEVYVVFTIAFQITNLTFVQWSDLSDLSIVQIFALIYSLVTSCLFLIPLSYLLYIQTTNSLQDTTTYERYTNTKNKPKKAYQHLKRMTTSEPQLTQQPLLTNTNNIISIYNQTTQYTQSSTMRQTSLVIEQQDQKGWLYNCFNMWWKNQSIMEYDHIDF